MKLPALHVTDEVRILAEQLRIAFEQHETKTVTIEQFQASYQTVKVDWEQVAKSILDREQAISARSF